MLLLLSSDEEREERLNIILGISDPNCDLER